MTMELFVAIDSGGSKTEALLFDAAGKIHGRVCGPGANPTDIGRDEAVRRLNIVLGQLLSSPESEVASLYGAMAGEIPNGDVFSDVIREKFGIELVRIEDDGCCIITGNLGRADGCALVCGTGSSLFVRRAGEKLRHIGGKGYLIDTGGSGFELGREALRAALRAFDGRGQPTVLTELLSERLGRKTDDGIIPMVHRGGRAFIASLSGVVFEGLALGDEVCAGIVDRQSSLLAELVHAAASSFPGEEFTVVAGGGLIAARPEYLEAVRAKCPPLARIELQKAPPIFGAALEAMYTGRCEPGAEFEHSFLRNYSGLKSGGKDGDIR